MWCGVVWDSALWATSDEGPGGRAGRNCGVLHNRGVLARPRLRWMHKYHTRVPQFQRKAILSSMSAQVPPLQLLCLYFLLVVILGFLWTYAGFPQARIGSLCCLSGLQAWACEAHEDASMLIGENPLLWMRSHELAGASIIGGRGSLL